MRKLAIALLVAAGAAISVPAYADGLWVGAGPVGVGIGVGPFHYDGPYGYYDNDDHAYVRGRHCRTVTVDDGFGVRRIHRCY